MFYGDKRLYFLGTKKASGNGGGQTPIELTCIDRANAKTQAKKSEAYKCGNRAIQMFS